ncbi:MAG: amino acid ABC transporter substrate-binding protein [Proteobacteria bacterium]|nr:amino acid ABC transporter substrate-binding protein [Pseudomonadota bacterium]
MGDKIIEYYTEGKVKETNPIKSPQSALKFLLVGRADVYIEIPWLVMDLLKAKEFKNERIIMLKPPVTQLHFYTYFLKTHSKAAERYDKALKTLKKEGTFLEIMTQTK